MIRIGPVVGMVAQPVQTLHRILLPHIRAADESILGFDGGTDLLSVEVETVVVLTLGCWFRTRLLVEPEVTSVMSYDCRWMEKENFDKRMIPKTYSGKSLLILICTVFQQLHHYALPPHLPACVPPPPHQHTAPLPFS